ncbi:MAG: hypothetical protein FWG66_06635 [Spirochaetes bacterium]|nr:hypothetical protein [Spirochaetota bacterium]
MKKLVLALTLSFALSAFAFAQEPEGWGVGVIGIGGDISALRQAGGWDMGLTIKPEGIPVYFGVLFSGLNFTGGSYNVFDFGMGVTADFHFLRSNVGEFRGDAYLDFFVGVGGFFGFGFVSWDGSTSTSLSFGGRLPVGLSFVVPVSQNAVEVFAALVPSFGFGIIHSSSGIRGGVGSELGVRIWL